MSTAARKDRKRFRQHAGYPQLGSSIANEIPEAGPFQHPVKTGTPLMERYENQPHNYRDTARRNSFAFSVPARARAAVVRRLKALGQYTDTKTAPEPELDPKPYRIGRKRYTIEESADGSQEFVFSPRSKYQQEPSAYSSVVEES